MLSCLTCINFAIGADPGSYGQQYLNSIAGEYWFSFSDTDEEAQVEITSLPYPVYSSHSFAMAFYDPEIIFGNRAVSFKTP